MLSRVNSTRQPGLDIKWYKMRASLLYDAFFLSGISYLPSFYKTHPYIFWMLFSVMYFMF